MALGLRAPPEHVCAYPTICPLALIDTALDGLRRLTKNPAAIAQAHALL